eukprot:8073929-Alexandrium_andersonii.AAC.1
MGAVCGEGLHLRRRLPDPRDLASGGGLAPREGVANERGPGKRDGQSSSPGPDVVARNVDGVPERAG